jgi:hypothetical protein
MVTINLSGRITPDGKLEVELPAGLPPGEVHVTIEVPGEARAQTQSPADEQPWTPEEITDMLKPVPPWTPNEWAEFFKDYDPGPWAEIADSQAWLDEQRRKRRERYTWE